MDKQKIFVVDDKDMIGKIIMACLGRTTTVAISTVRSLYSSRWRPEICPI